MAEPIFRLSAAVAVGVLGRAAVEEVNVPPLHERAIGRLVGPARPEPAPEVPPVPRATERRGPSRIQFSTSGEPSYSDEERAFMAAVQDYKKERHRPHPTLCEILSIARALGYRKTAEATELPPAPRRLRTGG